MVQDCHSEPRSIPSSLLPSSRKFSLNTNSVLVSAWAGGHDRKRQTGADVRRQEEISSKCIKEHFIP